ncbi:zinc finger and BTB domain-containing protein 41 [Sarotherodon galilaeus]
MFEVYSLTGMAAHLIILLLFSVLKGVHSTTIVSKVSVKAGKSISIPCLYHYQYTDHVKYLCEGYFWPSCRYAVKTNEADPSGKYLISDDKKQQIFTVTINRLTNQNTHYWCGLENRALDNGVLYVDHQRITGYIGENITIRCHHSNSGEMKWCRLGRNCVTGSSGSIDGTTVTAHMRDSNVFTVTMSGLKSENTGWYWCAEGDIQIPVYLTVTEKFNTMSSNEPCSAPPLLKPLASFDPKILIIPLSVLTLIVTVMLYIWFIMRHTQEEDQLVPDVKCAVTGVEERPSCQRLAGDEVTYSEVRPKKKRSPKPGDSFPPTPGPNGGALDSQSRPKRTRRRPGHLLDYRDKAVTSVQNGLSHHHHSIYELLPSCDRYVKTNSHIYPYS